MQKKCYEKDIIPYAVKMNIDNSPATVSYVAIITTITKKTMMPTNTYTQNQRALSHENIMVG
jgi:hypothetical protein